MPRYTLAHPNGLRRFVFGAGSLLIAAHGLYLSVQPLLAGDYAACVTGAGSCLTAHSTPGCDAVECCNMICDLDPFCCEGMWDDTCAGQALDMCDADSLCPGQEDCHTVHSSPGCVNDGCCADVCDEMLSCCQGEWTQECVDLALEFCPCGAPGAESCAAVHESEGCDDQTCCERLCSIDSFCCFAAWDDICVAQAAQFCAASPCTLQCPAGAVKEPESCGALLNEGCNGPIGGDPAEQFTPIGCGFTLCGRSFADGTRDTDWYQITVDQATQLVWTVAAEFPAAAMIVTGSCTESFGALSEAFSSYCAPASAAYCVEAGTYYLFVSPATAERTLRSGAECPVCPADLTENGVVNASDLALLLGAWGPQPCSPSCHPADLTQDGVINASDLALLLGAWGPCPMPAGSLWGNDYVATLTCQPCAD